MPEQGKGYRQWQGYRPSLKSGRASRNGRSLYRLFLFLWAMFLFAGGGGALLWFGILVDAPHEVPLFKYLLCYSLLAVWAKLVFKILDQSWAQDRLLAEREDIDLREAILDDQFELNHYIRNFGSTAHVGQALEEHERVMVQIGLPPEKVPVEVPETNIEQEVLQLPLFRAGSRLMERALRLVPKQQQEGSASPPPTSEVPSNRP